MPSKTKKRLFWDALTNQQWGAMGCVKNNISYDTLIEVFMLALQIARHSQQPGHHQGEEEQVCDRIL